MNPLHLIQPSPGGTRPAGPSGLPVDRRSSGASAEDRLAHIGLHDPLTGLPNQCTIAQHLEYELARAQRDGDMLAALYVDLDHFRHVNDALGHAAGDEVLVHAAERIRRAARGGELVARLGSDEFLHLCRVKSAEDSRATAAKLIEQLDGPPSVHGVEFQLGASIGIAIAPEHGRDARELLKHAHAAMYQAKHAGRSTWALYTDDDDEDSHRRLTLTSRLRRALADDELVLHYQSFCDVAAGAVGGVEALVRWQDPAGGLVAPGAFIPHAEQSRLITDIGAWVIEAVCRQAVAWRAQGLAPRISFNAAPRELRDAGYVERLAAALARHALAPQQFMLEVTESALVGAKGALSTLDALHRLGVVLAIDDFGTQYSSLARLRELPVGVLKIDRSFLLDVPRDPQAAAIVEAIASLGRALDMDVVVEGVETPAQLELARRAGCRYAQGYHLAWPLPAAEMTSRLASRRPAMPRSSIMRASRPRAAGERCERDRVIRYLLLCPHRDEGRVTWGPEELNVVLHREIDDIRRRLLAADASGDWTLDTALSAWREAQEQATIAYAGWRNSPGATGYAVYRAAQDRADAAQDTLRRRLNGTTSRDRQ